ncbi:antitoxin VbhA family protein [Accumulibacter sp.]|uniref:antitoxin VbhA family protein n=1 Tax=Accumulibacter sp. TaxID=2053492 RepID=UPI0026218B73|nr:antitoxin VbhA family protein [Accumulibacter sp.]
MITDEERRKRLRAYEIAKKNSIDRGVELTPETEEISKRFINGEIGEQEFFLEIWKLLGAPASLH